jgi:hypothetical protein
MQAAIVLKGMMKQGICVAANYTVISTIITQKGGLLEDDAAKVQDAASEALACFFSEQMQKHTDTLEQAKFEVARDADSGAASGSGTPSGGGVPGLSSVANSAVVKRMSATFSPPSKVASTMASSAGSSTLSRMVKMTSGSNKQIVEAFEFRAVVDYLVKQVLLPKGSRACRAGHVAALGYLVRDHVLSLENDDFEWLVETLLSVLHFDVNTSVPPPLTPEELTYLQARLSHLIKTSIISELDESRLLVFATFLVRRLSNLEAATSMNELELQLAMNELNNALAGLGEVSMCVCVCVCV